MPFFEVACLGGMIGVCKERDLNAWRENLNFFLVFELAGKFFLFSFCISSSFFGFILAGLETILETPEYSLVAEKERDELLLLCLCAECFNTIPTLLLHHTTEHIFYLEILEAYLYLEELTSSKIYLLCI